jgi:hypothetical protein
MLALFAFLAALLWGSFVGAKLHRGYPSTKIHLPNGWAIFGDLLFTLPVASVLFFDRESGELLITAGVLAVVGWVIVIFGEVGLLEYREALTLRGRRNSSGSLECCNWPFVKRQDASAVAHDCG